MLNMHLYRESPFHAPSASDAVRNTPIMEKSERYLTTANTADADPKAEFLSTVPMPNCLARHTVHPSPCLSQETGLNKITGFRIQVTGRRGTRSAKQILSYGKLDTGSTGSSYVDFARSHFVHKKGVTGVKVWVGYSP